MGTKSALNHVGAIVNATAALEWPKLLQSTLKINNTDIKENLYGLQQFALLSMVIGVSIQASLRIYSLSTKPF